MAGKAAILSQEDAVPAGDNRRWGADRRQFSYSFYVPERRSGIERRANLALKYRALARGIRFGLQPAGPAWHPNNS